MHQPVVGSDILPFDLRKVLHVLPVCLNECIGLELLRFVSIVLEVIDSIIYLDKCYIVSLWSQKAINNVLL